MPQKIIMHDQVFNKVEGIMNHYKRKPMEGLMRLLKQFMGLVQPRVTLSAERHKAQAFSFMGSSLLTPRKVLPKICCF